MKTASKSLACLAVVAAGLGFVAGCEADKGPVTKAGEKVDRLIEGGPAQKAGRNVDNALGK